MGAWSKCKPPFVYRVKVVAIVDPSTLVLSFDLGFGLRHELKVRLFGLRWNPSAVGGGPHVERAEGWIRAAVYGAEHLTAEVFKCGGEGVRCEAPACRDGDCYCVKLWYDGELLNDRLVDHGFAKRWSER